ncbi:gamma-mobile-trio protein GmtX [Pseudomonas gingeri]|uniref:Uncharacterized protein n=1 Tax=Pseudomonas gingeri TaxID=117681 RepID=A0A7Y7WJD1_9PSED|nr:gamma-mobile-trio protein GmtX [Pseudomonas gingeri]NWB49868.1 hypothetical protein [Pseudomonas gingeri]
MNEQLIKPGEVYERLMGAASDPRRKRSLEALNDVCKLLHERSSSDFSYKAIVTLGTDRGLPVPGEKSIQNTTGSHYRELIQAWKLIAVSNRGRIKPTANDWIEHIRDPVLRMSVSLLAEEVRALKAKESRKAQQSGAPVVIGSLAGQIVSPAVRLNDAELAALKAAIDPTTLRLVGFSIGSRGEVIDSAGRKIQKPGFRDAIEKILSLHLG